MQSIAATDTGRKPTIKIKTVRPLSSLIALSLLLLMTPLLAATDDIQLPDIVIVGQTEKLPDTISLDQLLQRHWSLQDLSEFEYRPVISFEPVKPYQYILPPEHRAALTAKAGHDFGDYLSAYIKGIYASPENRWHRYSLTLQNETYKESRQTTNSSFIWFPALVTDNDSLSYRDKHPLYTALSFSLFEDETQFTNDIRHFGFGIGFNTTEEFLIFTDTYLSLALNHFTQERKDDDDSFNDLDLILLTTIPIRIDDVPFAHIPVKLSSVRKKEAVSIAFIINELFLFDNVGLYLVADDSSLLPSAIFNLDYHLNRQLSIHLDNTPFYESKPRTHYINDNPDIITNFDNPLTKTILNSTVSLNSNYLLPLSLSYNVRWNKDYHYYGINADSTLFQLQDTDLLEHNVTLSSAYHYRAFSVRIGTCYSLTDKDNIPFRAEWEHSLTAGWNHHNTSLSAKLSYLTGRYDTSGNSLNDPFLLDFYLRQRLTTNLALNIDLNNILGHEYSKYSLPPESEKSIPHTGFKAQAGLSWSF